MKMNQRIPRARLLVLVGLCAGGVAAPVAADNVSLSELYTQEKLQQLLAPRDAWRPFPTVQDRAAWNSTPPSVRAMIVELAEKRRGQETPPLPATLYLEYQRTGNRSNYQDAWYERRIMLHELVLAECLEDKGRFLDDIVNVLWAICEESSWTWPAHIGPQKAGTGLPDTTDPVVALFSAETASSLAWTTYLLGERLDAVSPLVRPRVEREIDARILTPYLQHDDYGWMGFAARRAGRYPNNWNPWVNSNVLTAALLVEKNEQRRLQLVYKVLRCLDNFLVPYPSDGSCDEGPSYWGRAGASLFDNLELLYSASNGRIDVYQDPAVQEIGRYIYRAHIAGDYFVCVGDCDARIQIPRDLVFRYGQRIKDPQMCDLAVFGLDQEQLIRDGRGISSLGRALPMLVNFNTLLAAKASSPPLVRDVWLGNKDMQLMGARDRAGSTDGWYVASWAGHNGQSHNHNDVGNFIVFADGEPVIVDVGRPTYTRQTFSRDRYKIWAMQSDYHNLPTINGAMQSAGSQYAAKEVRHESNESAAELAMDIASSYPREAGVQSWVRAVRLVRGQRVEVEDSFRLAGPAASIVQNLMTPCRVSRGGAGELTLQSSEGRITVQLAYEPASLSVEIETIDLDDGALRSVWGPRLYRIRLEGPTDAADGKRMMRFVRR